MTPLDRPTFLAEVTHFARLGESTQTIAARLGVAPSSLYRRLRRCERLDLWEVLSVPERRRELLAYPVEEAVDDGPAGERVLVRGVWRWVA